MQYYLLYNSTGAISEIVHVIQTSDEVSAQTTAEANGLSYIVDPSNGETTYTSIVNGELVEQTAEEAAEAEAIQLTEDRRDERRQAFTYTLDKMNPIWYEELSSTEQDDLREWRQTWLDYPATGIKPDDLDIFNR